MHSTEPSLAKHSAGNFHREVKSIDHLNAAHGRPATHDGSNGLNPHPAQQDKPTHGSAPKSEFSGRGHGTHGHEHGQGM